MEKEVKSFEKILSEAIESSMTEEDLISENYEKINLDIVKYYIRPSIKLFVKENWWYLEPLSIEEQLDLFSESIREDDEASTSRLLYRNIDKSFWKRACNRAIAIDLLNKFLKNNYVNVDLYNFTKYELGLVTKED